MIESFLLFPEILISVSIGCLLALCLCPDHVRNRYTVPVAAGFSFAAACAALATADVGTQVLFGKTLQVDGMSQILKSVVLTGLGLISCFWKWPSTERKAEIFFFMNTAVLGMALLCGATDALLLYVSLQLTVFSTAILIAISGPDRAADAGLKLMIFGIAAGAVMLYGLSLLIGLCQTTSLSGMAARITGFWNEPAALLGIFLFAAPLFAMLSLWPFHAWTPDVYSGSRTGVAAFIATAFTASALAVLIRFFTWFGVPDSLMPVLATLAVISMTAGNAAALHQRNVKRLMACLGIAQTGYLFVAFTSGSRDALTAGFFFTGTLILSTLVIFLVFMRLENERKNDNLQADDLDGLSERAPFLSFILLLGLLSFAGVPPLAGFTAKWLLFTAAVKEQHLWLVFYAAFQSLVTLFCCLRLVKHAYLYPAGNKNPFAISFVCRIVFSGLLLLILGLGIYPLPFFDLARF